MPNSNSARKRLRQNQSRAERNKAVRSAMRTLEKKVLRAIEAGNKQEAMALLPEAYQRLDKAAKQRIVHPNTAANHKSRLARRIQSLA